MGKWISLVCGLFSLGLSVPAGAGVPDLAQFGEELIYGGPKNGIPALTNPAFVPAAEVDYLVEDNRVLGVYLDGEARAYPENVGWWHEVINDRIGERFITATLCPLTGTGLVFDTTDEDGEQIELGVSGLLVNSNLVMFDRRDDETLYPQMVFTGISGAHLGERLELLPALETTWSMWKRLHPDTKVPVLGTGWERYAGRTPYAAARYREYPYADYRTNHRFLIFPPLDYATRVDRWKADNGTRLNKEIVLGICQDGQTKAYPFQLMPDGVVINDVVGSLPLLVLFDAGSRTAIPFERRLDGQVLNFYALEAEGDLPVAFADVETGSRWNMAGEAVAGPLRGRRLEQVPAYNAMWFAWAAFWPATEIWNGEGIAEAPITTVVEEAVVSAGAADLRFVLDPNFPNPFNSTTQIRYRLQRAGRVHLSVFNESGQVMRTLVDEYQMRGTYIVDWDGRNEAGASVSSGVYLYRLEMQQGGLLAARTMTLIK